MADKDNITSQKIIEVVRGRIDDNRKSLDDLLRVYLYRILVVLLVVLFAWVGGWMPESPKPVEDPADTVELRDPIEIFNEAGDVEDPMITPADTAPEEAPVETVETAEETVEAAEKSRLINRKSVRYVIMPMIAFIFVMFSGMRFLQDIYALKHFRDAAIYVMSSMFGAYLEKVSDLVIMLIFPMHPKLTVDDGKKIIARGKTNLIASIGGPGYVIVQPGNAVFFKYLRRPSSAGINRSVFLAPFESPGPIVNLDDQHGMVPPFETMTKDGILVEVKDVQFRYRIIYQQEKQRTLEDPYPFDHSALMRRGANVTVNAYGPVPWTQSVSMAVKTAMTEYINSHMIDFMTAPRKAGMDVRQDFTQYVLHGAKVGGSGAELLWLDVGHVNIVASTVDSQRVELWASDWQGNADVNRAFGEAKRIAYQDIARAEARADMIVNIASALNTTNLGVSPKDNVRKILLERTAQILESMRDNDALGVRPDQRRKE